MLYCTASVSITIFFLFFFFLYPSASELELRPVVGMGWRRMEGEAGGLREGWVGGGGGAR